MTDNISAAAAAAYRGKTVVVKYGGNAIADPELQRAVIDDIAYLHGAGVRIVLVHGGGSEINAMLGRVGIDTQRLIDEIVGGIALGRHHDHYVISRVVGIGHDTGHVEDTVPVLHRRTAELLYDQRHILSLSSFCSLSV